MLHSWQLSQAGSKATFRSVLLWDWEPLDSLNPEFAICWRPWACYIFYYPRPCAFSGFKSGVLNFALGLDNSLCGAALLCRNFSSIPGLCPRDAGEQSHPQSRTTALENYKEVRTVLFPFFLFK